MRTATRLSAAALLASSILLPSLSFAQVVTGTATVVTDLNLRVGPGPGYLVLATIPTNTSIAVYGCIQDLSWCDVEWDGRRGWVYAAYLTYGGTVAAPLPAPVPLAQATVGLPPTVTYEGEAYFTQHYQTQAFYNDRAELLGAAGGVGVGAAIGAIIAGPIGAAVGAGIGAAVGAAVVPPQTVVTYIQGQPQPQAVYLTGEVVVGAALPPSVTLSTIPDYPYGYASVNGQIVLVDPNTRAIVYVMR